jgi:inner membrane protein YidH
MAGGTGNPEPGQIRLKLFQRQQDHLLDRRRPSQHQADRTEIIAGRTGGCSVCQGSRLFRSRVVQGAMNLRFHSFSAEPLSSGHAGGLRTKRSLGHSMEPVDNTLDRNTELALRRSFLAAERTLMAWIRTSISMIGFGFTLAKLFQSLADQNVLIRGPRGNVWTAEGVGMVLLSLGTFALIVAVFDHRRQLKQLQAVGLGQRFSLTVAVASVLAILGVMALLSLVVSL